MEVHDKGPQISPEVGDEFIQQPQEDQIKSGKMQGNRVVIFLRTIGTQIHALYEKIVSLMKNNESEELNLLRKNFEKIDQDFEKINSDHSDAKEQGHTFQKGYAFDLRGLGFVKDQLHTAKVYLERIDQEVKHKHKNAFKDMESSISGLEKQVDEFALESLEEVNREIDTLETALSKIRMHPKNTGEKLNTLRQNIKWLNYSLGNMKEKEVSKEDKAILETLNNRLKKLEENVISIEEKERKLDEKLESSRIKSDEKIQKENQRIEPKLRPLRDEFHNRKLEFLSNHIGIKSKNNQYIIPEKTRKEISEAVNLLVEDLQTNKLSEYKISKSIQNLKEIVESIDFDSLEKPRGRPKLTKEEVIRDGIGEMESVIKKMLAVK